MKRVLQLTLCILFACGAANLPVVTRADQSVVLFDFEQPGLAGDWTGERNIRAERSAAPGFKESAEFGPGGQSLAIQTAGQGGLFTKRQTPPRHWANIEQIAFWVYRKPPPGVPVPSEMEVQFLEADGGTKFWRRVELSHEGWQRIELPLHWFRWGAGRVPRWDHVEQFGFWFRDAAEVYIDTVVITEAAAADKSNAGELTNSELGEVAFPNADAQRFRSKELSELRILTDATELDLDRLSSHLQRVAQAVQDDMGESRLRCLPTLIVFQDERSYRAFPRRLAKQLGSSSPAPRSSGYTLHGIATSFWDAEYGTLRPVYTHEFVHSLVALRAGIPNHGQWLHEGLAVRYQMRFHPQADLRAIVLRGLADEPLHEPLAELCTDRPIASDRYWQAMTVVEMLIEEPRFAKKWPQLVAAFSKTGSADLSPHLEPFLETNWSELDEAWRGYCRRKYGTVAE